MIDLRRLREDPSYRAGAEKKGAEPSFIERLLNLDEQKRSAVHDAEQARAAQNAASKAIGRAEPNDRQMKIEHASELKNDLEKLEEVEAAPVSYTHLTLPTKA